MGFLTIVYNNFVGQNYDLNNVFALSLKMFHKASTTFGTDAPMGSIEIPLSSIKPYGFATDQWYPLRKCGRMKDVSGEMHIVAFFSGPPAGDGPYIELGVPSVVDLSPPSQQRPHHLETANDDSFVISSMLKYAKMPLRELTVSGEVFIREDMHQSMGERLIYHRIFPKCSASIYTSVGQVQLTNIQCVFDILVILQLDCRRRCEGLYDLFPDLSVQTSLQVY
jgi:hypothetical protein